MLVVTASCDKTKTLSTTERSAEAAVPPSPTLDLSERPDILFQVFGERDDPRMIPIAAIQHGAVKPIELTEDDWRAFDSLYTRSGANYTLYRDGQKAGTVQVRQGMWEKADEPLYSLPNCKRLTPLAAVGVQSPGDIGFTLELMAGSANLGRSGARASVISEAINATGRKIAQRVATESGLEQSQLDKLNFRALGIATGTSDEPTVMASYMSEQADADAGSGRVVHVFALGDANAGGTYSPSFTHVANAPASSAEYRRYVDHLDITGDGVDEIVLEGWKSGGDTYLMILGFRDGHWTEIFRGRPSWCLDQRAVR
jgi:hypothetical protein